MEYLHDRGQFLEPPIEAMRRTFDEYYPGWPDTGDAAEADFGGEVADETATR
jgi:hypothetical protein